MALTVVGKPVPRYDGWAHVTGRTTFVDDVYIPGTLTVKAFRSPIIKGKIIHLDISAAEATPGVAGVISARDVPNNAFGMIPDQPVLASSAVRFRGEPIAAVAAVDEDTALEAIAKIKVDFEEEEYVLDPFRAMEPDAPKVRPEGNLFIFDGRPYRQIVFGDIEKGFAEADVTLEGCYHFPTAEHTCLETQVSLAVPGPNGSLTVHTASQAHYFHLGQLCSILGLPMHKVKMVGGTVGGGFGAKNDIQTDHVTALLALKTGQPVKWRWTREEELLYSTYRGRWHIKILDGVKKDGRLVARQVSSMRDGGAYTLLGAYVVDKHCYLATGPYFIPNVRVEGRLVYTNKPPASSMRGFGITPVSYATEVQMDRIAAAVGKDPWEIRLINAYRDGDMTPTRRVLDSVAAVDVMRALAEAVGVQLPAQLLAGRG